MTLSEHWWHQRSVHISVGDHWHRCHRNTDVHRISVHWNTDDASALTISVTQWYTDIVVHWHRCILTSMSFLFYYNSFLIKQDILRTDILLQKNLSTGWALYMYITALFYVLGVYEWIALILYGCVSNTKTLISQLLLNEIWQFFFQILLGLYPTYGKNMKSFGCRRCGVFKQERSKISVFGGIHLQKSLFCTTILIGWK